MTSRIPSVFIAHRNPTEPLTHTHTDSQTSPVGTIGPDDAQLSDPDLSPPRSVPQLTDAFKSSPLAVWFDKVVIDSFR